MKEFRLNELMYNLADVMCLIPPGGGTRGGEIPWCFSQVKGTIEDEVAEGRYQQMVVSADGGIASGERVIVNGDRSVGEHLL